AVTAARTRHVLGAPPSPLSRRPLGFALTSPKPIAFMDANQPMRQAVEAIYRTESRRVLATLIRLLGQFDLAEEALHDAFTAAVEQWSRDGIPANPRAWLVSTGRFKAIDKIRRRARFDASLTDLALTLEDAADPG